MAYSLLVKHDKACSIDGALTVAIAAGAVLYQKSTLVVRACWVSSDTVVVRTHISTLLFPRPAGPCRQHSAGARTTRSAAGAAPVLQPALRYVCLLFLLPVSVSRDATAVAAFGATKLARRFSTIPQMLDMAPAPVARCAFSFGCFRPCRFVGYCNPFCVSSRARKRSSFSKRG